MDFYIVDVFAEEKYQGNQLAVLIPARAISTEEMQKIAREINFSETTFILSGKQDNGGYDVRIFTPDIEIPFAGHPTLGTALVIQQVLEKCESKQITLNLGVGQIPVTIVGEQLIMKQNPPELGMIIPNQKIFAEMLQIPTEDMDSHFPIQIVSTGLPAVIGASPLIWTVKGRPLSIFWLLIREPYSLFRSLSVRFLPKREGQNKSRKMKHR